MDLVQTPDQTRNFASFCLCHLLLKLAFRFLHVGDLCVPGLLPSCRADSAENTPHQFRLQWVCPEAKRTRVGELVP